MSDFLEKMYKHMSPRVVHTFEPKLTDGKLECVIILEKEGSSPILGWASGTDVNDCIKDIQNRLADSSYSGRMVTKSIHCRMHTWYE